MDTSEKTATTSRLNIPMTKEIRNKMKSQAYLSKEPSISKIWAEAAIFFLKSRGISVTIDEAEAQIKDYAENTV